MRFSLFIIFALVISASAFAQPNVNKKDDQDRKTGKWLDYHPNGKLRYTGMFRDGYELGTFTYYNGTGQMTTKLIYSQQGEYANATMFYSNGVVKAEGKFHNKKKDGEWKYFGQKPHIVKKEESYKDGVNHGAWRIYFPSGKLSSEIYWKDGKRDGEWNEFFENGDPRVQASFENGQLHGQYTLFYIGEIQSKDGNYVEGKMNGIWKVFNEKGQLIEKRRFAAGFLQEEAIFVNGKLSSYKSFTNTKFEDDFKNGE